MWAAKTEQNLIFQAKKNWQKGPLGPKDYRKHPHYFLVCSHFFARMEGPVMLKCMMTVQAAKTLRETHPLARITRKVVSGSQGVFRKSRQRQTISHNFAYASTQLLAHTWGRLKEAQQRLWEISYKINSHQSSMLINGVWMRKAQRSIAKSENWTDPGNTVHRRWDNLVV